MTYPNVHTVYWGEKESRGRKTGQQAWVCLVERKQPMAQSDAACVPQRASDGELTDVIECPQMQAIPPEISASALNQQQQCQTPTVPGGSQIQPRGARWVGTLGCLCISRNKIMGLTNYHVTIGGQFGQGHPITQPSSNNRNVIGRNSHWGEIDFRGGQNKIDAALFDCEVNGKHTLRPEQLGIGSLNPEPVRDPSQGTECQKSGRTTGETRGRIEGTRATTSVNYGQQGNARFVDCLLIRGSSGQFSGPGDSGSLIVDMQRRPLGLLFAGGGGTTIACRIDNVMDELGVSFWRG